MDSGKESDEIEIYDMFLDHPVVKMFMDLTSTTSPFPHDMDMFVEFLLRNNRDAMDWEIHEGGLSIEVGKGSSTLFIAHIDTADHGTPKPVEHVVSLDGKRLFTDGNTILGADDKAGVALLLWMIDHEIPGTYIFVVGEERGMVGSEMFKKEGFGNGFLRAIQFDRRGYDSVITHQLGERTCSETFATAVADELNRLMADKLPDLFGYEGAGYEPDPTGSYTDSYQFRTQIPECTNISVGYQFEHTPGEEIDLSFLVALAEAVLLVGWETLPVERNPDVVEYDSWSQPKSSGFSLSDQEYYEMMAGWIAGEADIEDIVYRSPSDAVGFIMFLLGKYLKNPPF